MELFLAFFVGAVGITAALSLARQRRMSRRYVLRSLGLVFGVYALTAALLWLILR